MIQKAGLVLTMVNGNHNKKREVKYYEKGMDDKLAVPFFYFILLNSVEKEGSRRTARQTVR